MQDYLMQLLKRVAALKVCPCTELFRLCRDIVKLSYLRTMSQQDAECLLYRNTVENL